MSVAPTMNGDSRKGYSPREKSPSSAPATFYTPSPRVSEQPSSRIWRSGQAFHYPLPGSGNHWKECKDRVDQFDQDFCAGWNSEIDSLLTFAGLFSAVVTAFTIESYKWLQPDSQDMSNRILLNISAQLSKQNITTPVSPPFSPSASSIRINIFWFLSLTFSLTAGLLGILCKQWLRRYQRDASLPHEKGLALHQFRYEGFARWKAVDVLGALPLLLEFGLVLFFIGLIDFLRSLNMEAAIPVIILIGAGITFLTITTMAPALQYLAYWAHRKCSSAGQYLHPPMFAFKSPQSCAVLRLAAWLPFSSAKAPDWTSFDIRFISNPITLARYTARALAWLDTQFAHSRDAVNQITLCMHDVALPVLQQLATELLNGAKRKRHTKPRRVDAESFEKFAEQVLSEPDVEEAVVRDIVTAVYLDHRLHVDHRRDDAPIVERRVRVLNASHRPVPPTLFYSAFKDLAISPELRWQKAMLLRTLLVQRRMQDPSAVAAEALDVCIHHGDFSDEDLESFFDAVYAWIGRDAGHREYVAQRIVGCVNRAISSERDSVGRFVHFLTRQGGS